MEDWIGRMEDWKTRRDQNLEGSMDLEGVRSLGAAEPDGDNILLPRPQGVAAIQRAACDGSRFATISPPR
jgi:hypothetical protein